MKQGLRLPYCVSRTPLTVRLALVGVLIKWIYEMHGATMKIDIWVFYENLSRKFKFH